MPTSMKKEALVFHEEGRPPSEIAGERELFPKEGKGVKLSFLINEKKNLI